MSRGPAVYFARAKYTAGPRVTACCVSQLAMDVDPSNNAKGGPPTHYGREYHPLAQEEPQELSKPTPPENTAWTDDPQPNAPLLQYDQPPPNYGYQAPPEAPGYGYQQQGYGYQSAPVPYQPTSVAYQPAPSAMHNTVSIEKLQIVNTTLCFYEKFSIEEYVQI